MYTNPIDYNGRMIMPYKNREDLYANQEKHREENKRKAYEYLSNNPCVDCGESDPIVLEFDHIDPSTKSFKISRRISGSTTSWKRIYEEILKCEIRCANCHRRRTAQQFNYYTT